MFVSLRHSMAAVGSLVTAFLIVVLLIASPASAGTLASDTNALPGWHGTQMFSGSAYGSGMAPFFHADVDYAVYELDKFKDSFPSQDTTGWNDYVYTYQIFNTGILTEESIKFFTVGLDGDELVGNIGFFDPGYSPDDTQFVGTPPTSAAWSYDGVPIPPGDPDPHGTILVFTSFALPHWDHSTMEGTAFIGATLDTQLLASPSSIPEPGTLTLLSMAIIMLAVFFPIVRWR